jgi:hypothetical protein
VLDPSVTAAPVITLVTPLAAAESVTALSREKIMEAFFLVVEKRSMRTQNLHQEKTFQDL